MYPKLWLRGFGDRWDETFLQVGDCITMNRTAAGCAFQFVRGDERLVVGFQDVETQKGSQEAMEFPAYFETLEELRGFLGASLLERKMNLRTVECREQPVGQQRTIGAWTSSPVVVQTVLHFVIFEIIPWHPVGR